MPLHSTRMSGRRDGLLDGFDAMIPHCFRCREKLLRMCEWSSWVWVVASCRRGEVGSQSNHSSVRCVALKGGAGFRKGLRDRVRSFVIASISLVAELRFH